MGELISRFKDSRQADEIPEGFKPIDQWAKDEGCSRELARGMLTTLKAQGSVEFSKFRVFRDGRLMPVGHYRLIPVSRNKKAK